MRRFLPALAFLALAYVLFFHHLDQRDLWSSHEARAGQNAQTILDTGDWLLPRLFDGRVEMQKPPLYYWLVAANAWLRGTPVDAWSVRIPAALAAVLGMLALAAFGWIRNRPLLGLIAATTLGAMVHYVWLGRVGRIDVPLTLTTSVALLAYFLAVQQPGTGSVPTWQRSVAMLVTYVCMGLGTLLKGPIGVILPSLVIGLHLVVEGELQKTWRERTWVSLVQRLGVWWGIPLFLMLAVPWFWLANERTGGELIRTFFWKHNLERGLGGDPDLEANPDAFWFYLLRLGPDLFPACLFLPIALYLTFRNSNWRADPETRFGLTWFVGTLAFLSLMRFKRADYLLPAYPGAALFLASVLERWLAKAPAALRSRVTTSFATLVALVALAWWAGVDGYLPRQESSQELRTFAGQVRERVPRPGQVILFRVEAHLLGFHLGKPYERIIEWENLDVWAMQPVPVYVVLRESDYCERERWLEAGQLVKLTSTSELAGVPHQNAMVLCVSKPPPCWVEQASNQGARR